MEETPSRPVALTGDIGGTKARFALCDLAGRRLFPPLVLSTREQPSLAAAIATVLERFGLQPTLVSLAVAAPIDGATVELTNARWSFTVEDVRRAAGTPRVQLLNDFQALARALPLLSPEDAQTVLPGDHCKDAPCLVVGPGTGFGAATLVPWKGGWIPLAGEGGHMDFGATSAEEDRVRAHLAARHEHVSVERVLSGSGLETVHAALGGDAGTAAATVVERAGRGDDAAGRAVRLFVRVLGRVAGDMALVVGARGGVYIGGGIAPVLLDAPGGLRSAVFRDAFRSKGRMSRYLATVPVAVITAPDAGLRGAAAALADLVSDADRAGWARA